MPLRPWSPIPIHDCGEPLQPIAGALWRLEPHPYLALGAPYGPDGNPFLLRSGVVDRLLQAQQALQLEHPDLRLATPWWVNAAASALIPMPIRRSGPWWPLKWGVFGRPRVGIPPRRPPTALVRRWT